MYVYAALGDSVTFGQNASSIEKMYPSRIISMLNSSGIQAKRIVFARPGWTSAHLAEALTEDSYPLRYANTFSVWIGGNDLIDNGLQLLQGSGMPMERIISQYEKRLGAIIRFIRTSRQCNVVCCTQYNPFPNSVMAVKVISMLNQAIIRSASRAGCRVARTDHWFFGNERRLIDGYRSGNMEEAYRGGFTALHPNDNGHSVIASGLYPFLYP